MSKYSLILSSHIAPTTKIVVHELCKNDESIFKEFADEIVKDINLVSKFAKAISIIENSANQINMPKTKFRQLEVGKQVNCKVYEAKAGIIRVYMFAEKRTGRIIVLGGKKNNQDKDIKSVIRIIKDYYNDK